MYILIDNLSTFLVKNVVKEGENCSAGRWGSTSELLIHTHAFIYFTLQLLWPHWVRKIQNVCTANRWSRALLLLFVDKRTQHITLIYHICLLGPKNLPKYSNSLSDGRKIELTIAIHINNNNQPFGISSALNFDFEIQKNASKNKFICFILHRFKWYTINCDSIDQYRSLPLNFICTRGHNIDRVK